MRKATVDTASGIRKWLRGVIVVALGALLAPVAASAADDEDQQDRPAAVAAAGAGGQRVDAKAVTANVAPKITSAATTTFTIGQTGTFTFTSTGTPVPTISLSNAQLPSGITFTNNRNGTGTLSGKSSSTSARTYTFTVRASNGVSPSASQSFTLVINGVPKFTSAASTACAVGVACSFKVTAIGYPLPSISRSGATLPAGMKYVYNGSGVGTLSGTPAGGTKGQYALVFTASNSSGTSAKQNFTLTVNSYLAFTSPATKTCVVGLVCTFNVTASGNPLPSIARSGGTLPSGMTFVGHANGTGTLSGTPLAGTGGARALAFTAHNGIEPDAVQSFALIVDDAPAITSHAGITCAVSVACAIDIRTTGYPAPALGVSGVALPIDVTFVDHGDGTGNLSGIPQPGTGGSYALVFTATNGVGAAAVQNFALAVNETLTITSAELTDCVVGTPCTFAFNADGAPLPALHLTGAALPAALIFTDNHDSTGALSGTPAAGTAGVYNLILTATNGVESDAVQGFVLTVNQAPAITSAAATTCVVGALCTFTVTTTGFPAPDITHTGDAMPAGLTYFDNGNGSALISGTAGSASAGVFHYTFTASNAIGTDALQSFTLTVSNLNRPTSALGVAALAGSAQATVSFLPPTSDGGVAISGYTATCTPDVGAPAAASGPSSPITVPNMTNGVTYTCTVHATNSNGAGPESAPSNPVTPAAVPAPVNLTVTLNGSGTGTVASQPDGIACPGTCAHSYSGGTGVVLTASATGGSVFTGWEGGGCTGAASTCEVAMTAPATAVTATFAPPGSSVTLDVDLSAPGTPYDAMTDGLLVLRYMFGLSGNALVGGALGGTATRQTSADIVAYLNDIRSALDADGNGVVDALTDGVLILRHLLGLTGTALTQGAVGSGAKRLTAGDIEAYLLTLKP